MRPPDPTGTAVALCSEAGARGCGHLVEFDETERYLVPIANAYSCRGCVAVRPRSWSPRRCTGAPSRRRSGAPASTWRRRCATAGSPCSTPPGALDTFMVDGSPALVRFQATVGPLIDRAGTDRRGVRVYGEMGALPWEAGDVASALRLEEHWSTFRTGRRFALLCAYPTSLFDGLGGADADAPAATCDCHTSVVPGEGGAVAAREEHRRELDRLHRELEGLRAELERVRGEQQCLSEIAFLEPLTGLANRRYFELELEREWLVAARDGRDAFLVVVDLDRFKRFEDHHGHGHGHGRGRGDEALRAFAGALLDASGAADVVAWIGGDEFAVLVAAGDADAPYQFERRLHDALGRRRAPLADELAASVGHSSLRAAPSAALALAEADHAMSRRRRAHRPNPARSC